MSGPSGQQQAYVPVVPNDSTVISPPLVWLWVATAGNLQILGYGDLNPVLLSNVPVGKFELPFPVSKVLSDLTTCGNGLVGLQRGP